MVFNSYYYSQTTLIIWQRGEDALLSCWLLAWRKMMTSSQEIWHYKAGLHILYCTLGQAPCYKSEEETDTQEVRAERWEKPGSLMISFTQPWAHPHSRYPIYEIILLHDVGLSIILLEAGSITMGSILEQANFAVIKYAKNCTCFIKPPTFSSNRRVRAGITNQINLRNRDDWIFKLKWHNDTLF